MKPSTVHTGLVKGLKLIEQQSKGSFFTLSLKLLWNYITLLVSSIHPIHYDIHLGLRTFYLYCVDSFPLFTQK